ncbi:DoxX family protein [Rothia sp. P13129]|uniref:DoxX family protein n=1 Tax=unclassified Rothia (in: high G+C Gram-positive bacteria) TaxID=2689056 RepID=UPI003ACE98DD
MDILRNTPSSSVGLLVLRLGLGIAMMLHGWQKYSEKTISGVTAGFEKLGIPAPEISANFTTYVELVGGLLIILGLATRLAALLTSIVMFGAIAFVHISNGFFASGSGFELPLSYAVMAVALVLTGPGAYAVDRIFARGKVAA